MWKKINIFIIYMIICGLCGCYCSLSNYCNECSQVRRLLLLHGKENFVKQVRKMFLKDDNNEYKKEKQAVVNELKELTWAEMVKKNNNNIPKIKLKQEDKEKKN